MVVDRQFCVGCNLCHRYRPFGVVGVDPELGKSIKCNLCDGQPRCVAACPSGALEMACREERHHG